MIHPILESLKTHGQTHLIERMAPLNPAQVEAYLRPLEGIAIGSLIDAIEHAKHSVVSKIPREQIQAPNTVDGTNTSNQEAHQARTHGDEMLKEGKIAILCVAGGMGTRLGWSGPKGTYPIGPVTDRTLFQIFAEQVKALSIQAGRPILWAIQTSGANHAETENFFEENNWFGVPAEDVRLFSQGTLPAFNKEGRIALEADGRPACLADGHGGVYGALEKKGILSWFKDSGVEHVFYFQVDNPLCPLGDAHFMGQHALSQSEMSTMVVKKTDPGERVGVLALENQTLRVIEYSEIDPSLAEEKDPDGQLTLRAGNTGIHAFSLEFLESMSQEGALPFHVANKPVPDGKEGTEPGYKLEYFVFDGLGKATHSLIFEVDRMTAFAPVKSAEGNDTPEQSRQALIAHHRRQVQSLGVEISQDLVLELSPVSALSKTTVKEGLRAGKNPAVI